MGVSNNLLEELLRSILVIQLHVLRADQPMKSEVASKNYLFMRSDATINEI
jgi:hypothetical protein